MSETNTHRPRCSRCWRTLKGAESIAQGMGPTCRTKGTGKGRGKNSQAGKPNDNQEQKNET